MPRAKGVVRLLAVSAVTIAGTLAGCGGSLGSGETGGSGGTAATGGTAGPTSGSAGTSGVAGTTGTAGAATAGTSGMADDAGSGFGQPVCSSEVYNAAPCTPSDVQLCYRACGVELLGVKPVTCTNYLYQQWSGCDYDPSRDYSCYKVPTAPNTVCPSGITPQASMACDVPPCTLCNTLQGTAGGTFLDSTGAAKIGYCVCRSPNASGTRTWSCSTDVTWPCPRGAGC